MTQQERYRSMTEENLHTLIPKSAIPTVITMLSSALYNLADTYFVSKLGTDATAAVGVVFSLSALIQALGFMIGIGSATYVSRLLGEKNQEQAERTVSAAFFTALCLGLLFMGFTVPFRSGLVKLLGATESARPAAAEYAVWILIGTPFMMGSFVLNNLMRAQGSAVKSMIGLMAGGLLNVALDPLFILRWNLGISGAALATLISQAAGFFLLLFLNNRSKTILSVSLRKCRPNMQICKEVLRGGLPSLFRQGLASLSVIFLNRAAGPFGTPVLAALSVVNRFMHLIYSVLIGYAQGFQPVCGFNFGAKRYQRVTDSYRFTLISGVLMISVLGLISYAIAPQVLIWFRESDPKVLEIGVKALRYQCFTLPCQVFMMTSQFLCQSVGYGFRASLIAVARQGLFLIPAYLIFPRFWGIFGLQIAQPCSDLLTAVLSATVMISVRSNLKKLCEQENKAPTRISEQ